MDGLVLAAQEARKNAYCPYSGYAVGAAVLGEDGVVYRGANLENVSYGLTICAERAAIAAMVAAGCTRIQALAVATQDGGAPCGACRQVIAEFAGSETPILSASEDGAVQTWTLGELLPHAFASDAVDRDGA